MHPIDSRHKLKNRQRLDLIKVWLNNLQVFYNLEIIMLLVRVSLWRKTNALGINSLIKIKQLSLHQNLIPIFLTCISKQQRVLPLNSQREVKVGL